MDGIGALGASGGMAGAYMQAYYLSHISAARSAAANPAQLESPVEPVFAVRRVAPDAPVRQPVPVREPRVPQVEDLNNAADNLARMRIQPPEEALSAEEPSQTGVNTYLTNAAGIS